MSKPDDVLVKIADYVSGGKIESREAYETARLCLMDSLGCALLASRFPACEKLLGPIVPGAELPGGARVPGTSYELDPVQAAFSIGCMIRWLDFNDTWLAAEWGHPSDNFGGILAAADYLKGAVISQVLTAAIKAYEIQGVLALENAFNRAGMDHVLLVRVATAAVVTQVLGGSREDVLNAVSNAWIDGGTLRVYRHAPNAGSRKSWAAGDAASRGVRLALLALKGEMGYPAALSAPVWGFHDALFKRKPIKLSRKFGSYVMENILFKVSYPAEFHAQTAVEAAVKLHSSVAGRLDKIKEIVIETQQSAKRIIDKKGPLKNPADRDHCLQYMAAVALIHGNLTAEHYEDAAAKDPRIDALMKKMRVVEKARYSQDYMDPGKRSIANSVQVFFTGGGKSEKVEIEYPMGHKRRRKEALPLLLRKFKENIAGALPADRCEKILKLFQDPGRLDPTHVREFMGLFALGPSA